MRIRIGRIAILLALIGLASGCSFFGGDEPEYTHWEPALSPDGSALAYESPGGDSLELFVRDLATGEERRLTQDEHPNWSPSWAPDGSRIAFASSRDDNVDIYILTLDDLSIERLTTHGEDDINPSWGADGRVYFNSNRSGAWEIYAITPGEGSLVKITQVAAPPSE